MKLLTMWIATAYFFIKKTALDYLMMKITGIFPIFNSKRCTEKCYLFVFAWPSFLPWSPSPRGKDYEYKIVVVNMCCPNYIFTNKTTGVLLFDVCLFTIKSLKWQSATCIFCYFIKMENGLVLMEVNYFIGICVE